MAALECVLLDIRSESEELVAVAAAAAKKPRRDGMDKYGDENDKALVMLLLLVETNNKIAAIGFAIAVRDMVWIRCVALRQVR